MATHLIATTQEHNPLRLLFDAAKQGSQVARLLLENPNQLFNEPHLAQHGMWRRPPENHKKWGIRDAIALATAKTSSGGGAGSRGKAPTHFATLGGSCRIWEMATSSCRDGTKRLQHVAHRTSEGEPVKCSHSPSRNCSCVIHKPCFPH